MTECTFQRKLLRRNKLRQFSVKPKYKLSSLSTLRRNRNNVWLLPRGSKFKKQTSRLKYKSSITTYSNNIVINTEVRLLFPCCKEVYGTVKYFTWISILKINYAQLFA